MAKIPVSNPRLSVGIGALMLNLSSEGTESHQVHKYRMASASVEYPFLIINMLILLSLINSIHVNVRFGGIEFINLRLYMLIF